jgi:hypothetical protein
MSQQSIAKQSIAKQSIEQQPMTEVESLCLETAKLLEKIHQSNRKYRKQLKLMLAEERILEWIINHHVEQQSNAQQSNAQQSRE